MAFSGAGHNDYFGAFFAGRLAGDPPSQMTSVKVLHAGESDYRFNRWGDYSHTTLDPNNFLAICTIQQYARTPSGTWRTWIAEMMPLR